MKKSLQDDQWAELIKRAKRLEPEAFDALLDAYSKPLYGYFYRVTGSRQDAEDLLQETFVRVVRSIDRYQDDGRFEAWIYRIAGNLVRDRLRKKNSTPPTKQAFASADADEGADSLSRFPDRNENDPAENSSRNEQTDRLQIALDRLPEHEREAICLRHFSQMSFQQIAELMEAPLGTVLARAHRGLKRLRELMEE
jgi:RNA polymerase sigma-70 factor (ECF subfamily)